MSARERLAAIKMLQYMPTRYIYQGYTIDGRCQTRYFFITKPGDESPKLDKEDIEILLAEGLIKEKIQDGIFLGYMLVE